MTSTSPFLRLLLIAAAASAVAAAGDGCITGCDLAMAIYYIQPNDNLTYIASLFGISDYRTLQPYNRRYPNLFIPAGETVVLNFPCRCLRLPRAPFSTYLAGSFPHQSSTGDTYPSIASYYNNLTTAAWLQATNSYMANSSLDPGTLGTVVNVTVNCSCGDPVVSAGLRLFLTYPLRDGETLDSVAQESGMVQSDKDLLKSYNPGADGVTGSRLVYIPLRGDSGREAPATNSTEAPMTARSWKNKTTIIIAVTVGLSGLCIIVLSLSLWYKKHYGMLPWQRSSRNAPTIESFLQKQGTSHPKRYTYSEIRRMTKSFVHKLGQGGYGAVYKGNLPDGVEIAVKMLKDTEANGEDFMNEVASISRTSHVNVVTLIGFCFQGSKRALVYEYMPNGSLDKHTFDRNSAEGDYSLTWDKLFDIVVGVARGLEYLHSGCNTRIVHFDIKPHNILLDQDFCPKISDFGLAKLCRQKESKISIAGARGTIGYIAPEVVYWNYGSVSSKSDVYSYGMVVLEMVGAREQIEVSTDSSSKYFPQWLYYNLDQFCGNITCEISGEITELVRKMTIVGLWCIQFAPADRPSISKVLEMLESSSLDLEMPPKAFYAG